MTAQTKGAIISILGCGWYGRALALHLLENGFRVKGSTTTPDKLYALQQLGIIPYLVNLPEELPADFFTCDVLVVAFSVQLSKRPGYLQEVELIRRLAIAHQVKQIILISSTSVYGATGELLNEQTAPAPETISAKALFAAENLLTGDPQLNVKVIRFGGLVGPERQPGRFLAGRKHLPGGLSPVNLIHLTDCVGLTAALILENHQFTVINGVAPSHPPREDFYQLAAAREGLAIPEFWPDKTDWKKVDTCYPEVYRYQVDNWLAWLKD